MGLLREPVATRSHHSWNNLATRYGRFCVQKRTEEGLSKNTNFRHRWFYVAEDLCPFRIIYSTYPSDFNDALPASSPVTTAALYPRHAQESSYGPTAGGANAATTGGSAGNPSTTSRNHNEGIVDSFLHWWDSDSGKGRRGSPNTASSAFSPSAANDTARAAPSATAAATSSTFFLFTPFTTAASNGPMERFTVATSSQLSGILEAWGLLMEAWEPEEAELNVMSFASPAMASPTTRRGGGDLSAPTSSLVTSASAAARVPFFERWRRTYGRIEVLCAEGGMERSIDTNPYRSSTPPSPTVDESAHNSSRNAVEVSTSLGDMSPLHDSPSGSRAKRADPLAGSVNRISPAGGSGSRGLHGAAPHFANRSLSGFPADAVQERGGNSSIARSFASRRHVHISDAYYADSPTPVAVVHFFDVLLIRVVDLLMWRDPQLTACCLGILVSVYGYAAWASALCYLAGETAASSSSQYCRGVYARNAHYSAARTHAELAAAPPVQRLWWGAPLFMICVLAYPWTREQQRRTVTSTDREHLRSIYHAIRWLSAHDANEDAGVAAGDHNGTAAVASAFDAADSSSGSGVDCVGAVVVLKNLMRHVCTALWAYKLPVSVLLLFNVIGAFTSWEAILVLFLWPMLIVSVSLAGVVVVSQCLSS